MKLLIVDDEKKIIDFLVNAIDWNDYNFTDILTFTSSKKAILKLDSGYLPDLLITDIRMPEVSGLDLVQKIGGRCKSIIISGYSDFEYAQQAIRYGVFDYLLKPIFPDELEKVIEHLSEEISIEKFTASISARDFYLAILSGNIVRNPAYLKVLEKLVNKKYMPTTLMFAEKGIMQFKWGDRAFGFIQREMDSTYSISQIQRNFFETVFQLTIPEFQVEEDWYLKDIKEMQWLKLVKTLNSDEMASEEVANILVKLRIIQVISQKYPTVFEQSTFSDVLNLCYKHHLADFLFSNFINDIKEIEDLNQTILVVQNCVKKNLSAPLSVEWLADKVHMHPVYLSHVYKQETKENLSQYILEERLKEMKTLLLSTDLKIKTITELVGYRKAQNIIDSFKKKYGQTPSQFRKIYKK